MPVPNTSAEHNSLEHKVEFTAVSYQSLKSLVRYMAAFTGPEEALALSDKLVNFVTKKLIENPHQFAVSHELESLGVTDYRAIYVDHYKVLFRYDAQHQVSYVMAFLRQKQSAQELLYQILIR